MRLIDADALMEKLMRKCRDGEALYRIPPSAIDNAPTITPESLARHGRWVEVKNPQWPAHSHDKCSICGWWNTKKMPCAMTEDINQGTV